MSNQTPEPSSDDPLTAWFGASSALEEPLAAAQGWWLVWGAADSGLLAAAQQPVTIAELGAASSVPTAVVELACRAFELLGVFVRTDDRFSLSPTWAALTNPGGFQPWGTAFGMVDARTRMLRNALTGGADYFGDDDADRLAYAKGCSPDPFRPGVGELYRASMSRTPELFELLDRRCDLLELGCGVAGNLCSQLQAFPQVRAVGVELAADLADEARHRAALLGLADRFEVVTDDVAVFRRSSSFDVAFWSQMFFPAASRQAALATALDSLRPGGLLMSPVVEQPDPTSSASLATVLDDLLSTSWGVPAVRPDELEHEFRLAGFLDVHRVHRAASLLVVGRRPISG
ncbi:MAG: class I SAM-dependent methyltransferase [Actinomycetota bacterium]